jgi:hypothetical protein
MAVYTPIKVDKLMENHIVEQIAAGEDFTIIVTKNKSNGESEVFGTGHNMRG